MLKRSLLLLFLSLFCCYGEPEEPDVYLIPENFEGTVFVIYDYPFGEEINIIDNQRIFKIPENGVLKTKFKQNKKSYKFPYFYTYNKSNKKEQIDFVLPGSFNSHNYTDKNQKLILNIELGRYKDYSYSMISVSSVSSVSNIDKGNNRHQLLNKVLKSLD